MAASPGDSAARNKGTARRVLLALGYLLASQLLFWPILIGAELLSRPSGSTSPLTITMEFIERQPGAAPGPQVLTRDAVPGYVWIDPDPPEEAEHVAFVHHFDAIEPGADMGLFMSWTRRIVEIEVNGSTLRQQTDLDYWGVLGGYEASAYIIPADVLRAKDNELRIIGDGRSRKIAPAFYVSTPADVLQAVAWGRMFDVELVIAAIAVMALVLLIILTARWPRADRYRMTGLAVLLGAWIVRNLAHLNVMDPAPDNWRLYYTFAIIFAFLAGLAFFLLRWTRAPGWTNRALLVGFLGLMAVLAVVNPTLGSGNFFSIAFTLEVALTIAICLAGMAALVWKLAGRKPGSSEYGVVETLLFLIALSVILFDCVDDRWDVMLPVFDGLAFVNYKTPAFGILLGLGLCATLAAQATATRNIMQNANRELTRRVNEQARALEDSFRQTAELERERATIEERQRILRDMHDGVGSLLLGLSVQIQGGRLSMDEVHDGIRKGITDLRLMVTAMDGVGDDLVSAMQAFEQRVRPDLEAEGIALETRIDLPPDHPPLKPRTILNVYRILQEAITNTLRHSGARRVEIVASLAGEGRDALRFSICDDGKGFDPACPRAGRGLQNIRQRARAIGAQLDIRSGDEGTCIELVLAGHAA